MGSQAVQGNLWGKRSKDWARIQERTALACYNYVLDYLEVGPKMTLLDVGCGSGLFSDLAAKKGAIVTGIDASDKLVEEAKNRNLSIQFMVGEMEQLPFDNETFDVVVGFNSFQYAADVKNALSEAKRVLKRSGNLVAMIWGNREECEASTYLKAVGSLLPPPPPGAPGPFALSENRLLESIIKSLDLVIEDNVDKQIIWDYPDEETALRGLMSAGPVARAIDHSGLDNVTQTTVESMKPFIRADGHVVYKNKYRIVIAKKE